jgi:hypothetical protein
MTTPEDVPKESRYEKLKAPIQEIIAFTNTIDEQYREVCFEVLLSSYLHGHVISTPAKTEVVTPPKPEITNEETTISLLIKGFLIQNHLSLDVIKRLFLIEKSGIVPIYTIAETKSATAQIQLALLTAFKNAIVDANATFEFSIEEVRERCKANEVYNGPNFMKAFKQNSDLFEDFNPEQDKVKLSNNGKAELAKTIEIVLKQ